METNIWLDVIKVAAGVLTGGGLWAWIKAREDKRKTPYDMFRDLLEEQKKFYEERNADYEQGKNDIDLNMTIPAGALFGVQVTGCYVMVAAGGTSGVVKDDYKNISSNGANYVGWTPGIGFAFAE